MVQSDCWTDTILTANFLSHIKISIAALGAVFKKFLQVVPLFLRGTVLDLYWYPSSSPFSDAHSYRFVSGQHWLNPLEKCTTNQVTNVYSSKPRPLGLKSRMTAHKTTEVLRL